MKKSLLYIASLMMAVVTFNACDDDFETPPLIVPTTDLEANTTIAEAKAAFWKQDRNYVSTVGNNENGEHIIIKGRVCSSDETGNIYKSFIIDDGTAALAVSVDTTKLYTVYHYGQEVVIDMTGLQIGGYNGLMQLGAEGEYQGNPSMTFMKASTMRGHCFVNGLAYPGKVDTTVVTLPEIASAKGSQQGLIEWQSRLVRIDGVKFEDAGKVFAESGTNVNRYISDASGNKLIVRNSGYSTFASEKLPAGTGSVVGILSYFGTDWQLLLNDAEGCIGFDGTSVPDIPDNPEASGNGTADAPYSVGSIIAGTTGTSLWVTGYIVGWVSDLSIESSVFNAEATIKTNLLLAASADETDYNKCLPVQLPAGGVRNSLNLQDNPENYKKQISLKADVANYFSVTGLKNTTAFAFGDKGVEAPVAAYNKVTSVAAGKTYLFVASDGSAAAGVIAEGNEFGYLPKSDVKVDGDKAEAAISDGYTLETAADGFYIKDSLGRYLWLDESHNSFQVSADKPVEACVFTFTANDDGTFTVTNIARSKTMQYSTKFSSWGIYPDSQGLLPMIFEKAN